jgi:acyl carrier protein
VTAAFDVLAAALAEVTGLDAAAIAPASRLDDELRIDSLEFATLAEALRNRYGDQIDLIGYVTRLDLDQLIALAVADLVSYLDSVGAG